jgi:hypothetical protein
MDLHLNLKAVYYDQIASGQKKFENRLVTEYWEKRLIDREYENVIVKRGYPKRGENQMVFPYRGYTHRTIKHEHFGDRLVRVFSIELRAA